MNQADWWRGAVIYQIYPRSFFDSNHDGIGDLNGITQKIDYLASLGVDALWVSPVFKSPMKDFGYDVSDFRDIDPIFGSLAEFDQLVAAAHEKGLKIMIDQVLNHTSDQHPWFVESRQNNTNPKADWYVWADAKEDGSAPNNWLSVFGGSAWQWDEDRQQFYLHNFLSSQPDLNFLNPEVRHQVLDETEFWLKRGVDGLRLDTVNYYFHHPQLTDNPEKSEQELASFMGTKSNPYNHQRHQFDKSQPENIVFLKELRQLMDRYPGTTTLGEIGDDRAAQLMGEYTQDGDKLNMAYCFRLLREQTGTEFIRRAVEEHEALLGDGWPCWAMSNHDTDRVASRWSASPRSASGSSLSAQNQRAQATLWMALLLTLRGSVCVYNGEELGLTQAEIEYEDLQDPFGIHFWPDFKGRDGCRTPLPWQSEQPNLGFSHHKPWLPLWQPHQALSVDLQEAQPDSTLNKFRQLVAWRKQQVAVRLGQIKFLSLPEPILGFTRTWNSETVVCLFNLSDQSESLNLESDFSNYTDITPGNDGSPLPAQLNPFEYLFLQRR